MRNIEYLLLFIGSASFAQGPVLPPIPPIPPAPKVECVECCKKTVKPKPKPPATKPPATTPSKDCKPEVKYVDRVVEKVVNKVVDRVVEKVVTAPVKKNTLSVLVGKSKDGVYAEKDKQGMYSLREGEGWIYGLEYEYKLTDDGAWSGKGVGITNGFEFSTGLVGVGWSW